MKRKRITVTLSLSKGLALTILALLILYAFTSCTTYKRCQQKFQTQLTVTDSVKVTVPVTVTVPRDSVVTTFKTDTTYLFKEIQQGRAKVIVERTNAITTVQAKCDTVVIVKYQPVKVPGQRVVWGVAPWYKTGFKWCLNALIIAIAISIILLTHRKKNDLQTPKNEF